MPLTRMIGGMLWTGLMVLTAGFVCGQDPSTGSGQVFPTKPIRIVTSPAGGGSDFVSRIVATGLSRSLGSRLSQTIGLAT